jgi:hypothetical protein
VLPAVDRLFGRSLFRRPAFEQRYDGNRFGVLSTALMSFARVAAGGDNLGCIRPSPDD